MSSTFVAVLKSLVSHLRAALHRMTMPFYTLFELRLLRIRSSPALIYDCSPRMLPLHPSRRGIFYHPYGCPVPEYRHTWLPGRTTPALAVHSPVSCAQRSASDRCPHLSFP